MTSVRIARELSNAVSSLSFSPPVAYVYNPLDYAWKPHETYLKTYGEDACGAILVGMNPGPFGMAQTGVPFGDVAMVRDWMKVCAPIGRPPREHPKRPILGFECPRSEVSGARLWGWARDRFTTPERFFKRFFVWNYCPLSFMEATGRNLTPDKLPAKETHTLFAACDLALARLAGHLRPKFIIGIGKFAEDRIRATFRETRIVIGRIPHPSPASPAANRGWAQAAEAALEALGIDLGD